MIEVKYLGTPAASIWLTRFPGFCLALESDGGVCSRILSVSSSADADGCA
jgi:hypothetical protein